MRGWKRRETGYREGRGEGKSLLAGLGIEKVEELRLRVKKGKRERKDDHK